MSLTRSCFAKVEQRGEYINTVLSEPHNERTPVLVGPKLSFLYFPYQADTSLMWTLTRDNPTDASAAQLPPYVPHQRPRPHCCQSTLKLC